MPWTLTEIAAVPSGAVGSNGRYGVWRRTVVFTCDECTKTGRRELRPKLSHTSVSNATYCTKRCAASARAKSRYPAEDVLRARTCKRCTSCKEEKSLENFAPQSDRRDGLTSHCITCRKERARANEKKRYADDVAAGKCVHCRTEDAVAATGACATCTAGRSGYHGRLRRDRIERGVCYACNERPPFAAHVCRECWFKRIASDTLGDSTAGPMLDALWDEQQGRCAMTGVPLEPGDRRVSLDHVVPRARGGGNERGNLRWVTYAVNRAKSSLLDDEFVEMCRRVVETHDKRIEKVEQKWKISSTKEAPLS
jgi:hypothetical protein